jgi:amino acid transporter
MSEIESEQARSAEFGRLEGDSVGLTQVLFQSIGHMAPATAVILALGLGFSFAGPAMPLSLLLALATCLLIANSVGQMAKCMPSAGGSVTYVARALGARIGYVIGGMLLLTEVLIPMAGGLALGAVAEPKLHVAWWILALATIGIYFGLNYRGIKVATNAAVVLGIFEIVAVLALAIWMIVSAGSANTLAVLNPANALEGGWSGVFKGVVFSVLAFQGFEAAAPLGEEARDPRRTIPRAVIGSALIIGLLYVVCAYGVVMGWGFDNLDSYASDPQPWITLSTEFWGTGWVIIFVALLNSLIAGGNAGMTYVSRLFYAMGRSGVLPRSLSDTHREYQTPYVAIAVETVIAAVGALVGGLVWGATNGFGVMYTIVAILILLSYMGICLASIVYFRRYQRPRFNLFLHGICPAVGMAMMAATLYYQFVPLPADPIVWGNWLALIWIGIVLLGLVYMLATNRRQALERTTQVFVEDEVPEPI